MDGHAAPPTEAGWYADAGGSWWWWDGAAWRVGPVVPASAATEASRDRSNALLVWVLGLLAGIVGVAVMFAVSKERTLARQHATEALNLSIVLLALSLPLMAVGMGWGLWWMVSQLDQSGGELSDGSFARIWLVSAGFMVLNLPLTAYSWYVHIKGLMAASRGETYRAPLPFRLVSGTTPE